MLKELKAKLIRLSNTKIQNACSRWEKPSFSRKRSRRRGGRAAASHRFCKNSSFWRQHIINNVRGHERGLRFFCCKKKCEEAAWKRGKKSFERSQPLSKSIFLGIGNLRLLQMLRLFLRLLLLPLWRAFKCKSESSLKVGVQFAQPQGGWSLQALLAGRKHINGDGLVMRTLTHTHTHNCCYTYTKSSAQPQKSRGLLKENIRDVFGLL